jgi:hypothetical protein
MTAKKRMTDKLYQPTDEIIRSFIGDVAWQRLMGFENMLRERYELNREMKFPFGSEYGWSFRYSHKKSLLLYVFFQQGSFCCTISINDKGASQVEAILGDLLPETQELWTNRYPCGTTGGWVHYSIESDNELNDVIRLLSIKIKPRKAIGEITMENKDKNQKIYQMPFSKVYPMLIAKAERKGRTKEDVDTIIYWLLGYDEQGLASSLEHDVSHEVFYNEAPQINPNARKIKGAVCGVRVEDVADPLMQKIRWLDKLVDELAKGKPMEKILRT